MGVEVLRLADLYERADRGALDDHLEVPKRAEFHTIYLGLRGRGTHVVDFAPAPLGAGFMTFVAHGRVRQFVIERDVDAWMLLVRPELVGGTAAAGSPAVAPAVLSPLWAPPALAVPPADHRELIALVEQLAAEQARGPAAHHEAVLATLVRLILLRADRLHAGAVTPAPPALERFFTILERDHAHTREVAHYARAAGVSARRLGELLVARLGTSTKQVINERVVLESKRLLVHTDLSVKELAARLGFAEPTNFVKLFRHHAGTTPQAFRAGHRMILPSGRRS